MQYYNTYTNKTYHYFYMLNVVLRSHNIYLRHPNSLPKAVSDNGIGSEIKGEIYNL